MVDRPLLPLPTPQRADRVKASRTAFNPNAGVARPSVDRQSNRIDPKFERLRKVAGETDRQAALALRSDPDGIAPERALVFEIVGSLADFYRQAQGITGLEFLVEDEMLFEPDADFYGVKIKKGRKVVADGMLAGRLYMVMPDMRALREILSLWDMHRRGSDLPYGFAQWGVLFELLKEVRAWGPQDRVLQETLDYWRERIAADPGHAVRFEVELWFHESATRRTRALAATSSAISRLGGHIVSESAIPEIRYHALLVDLPAEQIEALLANPTVTLARVDDIMFLRPQSVAAFPLSDEVEDSRGEAEDRAEDEVLDAEPIAALLDGVPLSNHRRLAGRLIIDDPDDLASTTPVYKRDHGTSMASLIVHGDLHRHEPALNRRLYVRPVMTYDAVAEAETTPPDQLPLDVIFLAVRRMFDSTKAAPAAASSVIIINLSLGDLNRPFTGRISPWARLLDWLAFHYRVLFLVSAGNISRWLPLPSFATRSDFLNADVSAREDAIIKALDMEKAKRSLLSPAEGLNGLAVGAWHADGCDVAGDPFNLTDPFPSGSLPNISSAVGLGYRRTIKPDLLYDGGRELVRLSEDEGHVWLAVGSGGRYAGQLAAAPDATASGRLDIERRTVGSSNATALLTRSAINVYEVLRDAGYAIPRTHGAVLLKALLVHGAQWGAASDRLDAVFGPPGRAHLEYRDNVARFLGYGRPEIERVLGCIAERATLFGYGDIGQDEQHEFDIPLPASIEGSTQLRRLTATLAWLTPVNARHQQYRSATLEIMPNGDRAFSLAVDRLRAQPNHNAVDRGTVFHSIFEGESAVAFLDGGLLRLRVTCRAQAGALDDTVPYAVAISLETAVGSGIAVYDEVRAAIQAPVRATVGG